jgi:hypothetical protein
MPIDPSIALGVKPIEIPNQLGQFAQAAQIQHYQQQNALADRAMQQEEALNRAYASAMNPQTGEIDANKLRQNMATGGIASKLPAAEKSIMEGRELKAKVGKSEFELRLQKADQAVKDIASFNTRDEILADLKRNMDAGNIDPTKAQQIAASVPTDPTKIPAWQLQTMRGILSAKDQLEQQFTSQDYGGGTRVISTPKFGGGPAQVVQGSQVAKTMTPGEAANLAKPVWNEAGQGWVTAPTKANPQGGFTPVPEVQATKDQRSAVKALKTAGYNIETGEDEISKLIEKSTGGVAQQVGSAALGAANITTSGREAIGRLKTRANQIGLDILGGKLGVGISNDDRKFIVEGLGNVADASIPAGERLAAWDEVKKRMVSSGMLPEPTKAPAAAGGGAVDTTNPLLK